MRLVPARAWALVVLSAILQLAIFPIAGPLPLWRAAIGWFALVPLLLALLQSGRDGAPLKLRSATLLGYVCGIVWYMGNCYWIEQTMHIYGGLPGPVSFLILILFSFYLGLYHALFAFVLTVLRRRMSVNAALLISPFLWVAVELARARITSFPWDLLGYSQIDNFLLTALAPFAGVMAISFVLAAINAAITWFVFAKGRSRFAIPICAAALALVLQVVGTRFHSKDAVAHPFLHTAIMMQENIEVGAVGRGETALSVQQKLQQFSAWSLRPNQLDEFSRSGPFWSDMREAINSTVIIWPEAPSELISSDPFFRSSISAMARRANAPAIIGSLGIDRDASVPRGFHEYDSASLFNANGDYTGRYDKIHLVPWGEYVPYKQFFSFADRLTAGVGDMDRGRARTVFSTGGHSYGVFVCYESIFGDEVRHFAANGAEVLVQISDDGWYGDSGAPWQHLNMARMRAIENHRWLLRSTNTGITTSIDPQGRMSGQAPRHTRAAYAFSFAFEPAANTTFYTRHGDWFAYLCTLISLAALIAQTKRKEREEMR
jgi:apolipoprotein N-acyltransferase